MTDVSDRSGNSAHPRTSPSGKPQQARSRERADALLGAARALTAEKGIAGLKMTEVGTRACVPIGSVYQYFPTRSALLHTLYEAEMHILGTLVAQAIGGARSRLDILDQVRPVLERIVTLHAQRPHLDAIWRAPAYDPLLRGVDLEDTKRNAVRITDLFVSLPGPKVDRADVLETWTLILHLGSEFARLVATGQEHLGLTDPLGTFERMVRDRLAVFVDEAT